MKRQYLYALVASIIATYLGISFVEFDLRPNVWGWPLRFVSILCVLGMFLFLIVINEENATNK